MKTSMPEYTYEDGIKEGHAKGYQEARKIYFTVGFSEGIIAGRRQQEKISEKKYSEKLKATILWLFAAQIVLLAVTITAVAKF